MAERHIDRCMWQGSMFDPEHTRVVVVGGCVVSTVIMAPRRMRFGTVDVPAMGIGPVATHDRHRKRGYGALSMNDTTRYIEENGIPVAYLGGIRDFHQPFGYYPFAPSRSAASFPREAGRRESTPGRLRAMRKQDLPTLRRIFDGATAERVGTAARDREMWKWLLKYASRSWYFYNPKVIQDGGGKVRGYVCLAPGENLEVREIVVKQDETSCRAAVGALVREAKRREVKHVVLPLPWDDALAVFLRQYVGASFTLSCSVNSGRLLKIVDLPGLMKRLEPEFSRRWRAVDPGSQEIRFSLRSEIGTAAFALSRNGVRIGEKVEGATVRIPQRWLSGFVTGYYNVRDVAPRSGASIPGRLAGPFQALFPTGWPYIYQADM